MKNIDSEGHVTGRSIYLDDIPTLQGTLYALVYGSPSAHGKIKHLDLTKARQVKGIETILTYEEVTGENQIGGIIPDEPLLAEKEVHFQGQPVALILAETELAARKARKLIEIQIDEMPVITDPRVARVKGELIIPPRSFELGNVENAWAQCEYVFEGRADSGGQEHLYIETQGAYAVPMENGSIKIFSSTQGPTAVQKTAARVLGVPMHKIEVDVTRLGGGFGGKEDQATPWAVMVALAAQKLKRPVKMSMHRMDDMKMTGKRHPYSSDFKIGLSKDLKIQAYEVTFHQDAGAAADLSPAVMERTLFHATNSYFIPNIKATAYSCRTNVTPHTAFRGFGGPQGMFVMESAIAKAAIELGVSAHVIQKENLFSEGDEFSFGQIATEVEAKNSWNQIRDKFNIQNIEDKVIKFNKENEHFKKGVAIQPICFGISFTNTPMNNARALVHVYQDGSVGISTGAVEMGQGVNTKMVQVAARAFSVDASRIKLETTNTTRVANTSPSAASATADLNGKALQIACDKIKTRLYEMIAEENNCTRSDIEFREEAVFIKGKRTQQTWEEVVNIAMLNRVCLSENGHYSTPVIHFDKNIEKGHPFAYHVYGTAVFQVTVDCVRGRYEVDSVKIVHDFGKSMNPIIDLGQIEGGLVQGIGWMTMEELIYNETGKLLSNALSTYKIPDMNSVPKEISVTHLETQGHEAAILKSKAVGEPPLMYGLGVFFALQNAIRAYNPDYQAEFIAPMTPERVLVGLYQNTQVPH